MLAGTGLSQETDLGGKLHRLSASHKSGLKISEGSIDQILYFCYSIIYFMNVIFPKLVEEGSGEGSQQRLARRHLVR